MYEKVSNKLKYDIYIKKYKFAKDYITLNEFLAVLNYELRNITIKRANKVLNQLIHLSLLSRGKAFYIGRLWRYVKEALGFVL